jgi:hypothetical protein
MLTMAWTALVATYAAIVSTGAFVVSILAWRSGGPSLQVEGWHFPSKSAKAGEVRAGIRITNRGRAETEIGDIGGLISRRVGRFGRVKLVALLGFTLEQGPPLPYRLPSHGSEFWVLTAAGVDDPFVPQPRSSDVLALSVVTPLKVVSTKVRWSGEVLVNPNTRPKAAIRESDANTGQNP